MSSLKLFLGFTPDNLFQKELEKANPYLVSLLIGKEDYLQDVTHQGQQVLGKFFEAHPSLDQIHDLEVHLLSLLQKLTPHYPFPQNPLTLITMNHGK